MFVQGVFLGLLEVILNPEGSKWKSKKDFTKKIVFSKTPKPPHGKKQFLVTSINRGSYCHKTGKESHGKTSMANPIL